ncbi:hypothetical protein [Amycolatopsis sp. NPDC051903]|uniref:hypothetical protein n=1 Tax=Amycolatopsis sp. NPDC051903 TaxID=3363936 RepID=UPI00378FF60D
MVHDDGSVTGAEAIQQEVRNGPKENSHHVRTDCPHAPHDLSCGHSGSCQVVHSGAECEAVRPVCPACFQELRATTVPGLVEEILRSGELVGRCPSCEALAFEFGAELVCGTCQWLVPHVNEELEDRFLANDGEFAPPPGSCAGCSQHLHGATSTISFDCPRCGSNVHLTLDPTKPGGTIATVCPGSDCGLHLTIPATVWCRVCGKTLRPPEVVRRLTLEANEIRPAGSRDAREDEGTRVARRLAHAAQSADRRYSDLTEQQRNLLRDNGFLDSLSSSPSPLADWVREVVEIRAIGHETYRSGGMRALRETHQRVMELGLNYRVAARTVELYWDGIGDWQK